MQEEYKHVARLRAGKDRSTQSGLELEAGEGSAAELKQRLGQSCWVKALWTHELHPELEGALWISQIDTGWGCWAGWSGEQVCAAPQV